MLDRMSVLNAIAGLVLLTAAAAHAANLPAAPQIFDASYSAPNGHTLTVNAGGDLQAALNQAQLGDTIVLEAGATFTGPFSLPNKTSGSGWIYVQTSAYRQLPAVGTRIAPADAANMPKLVAPANDHAITTVNGSHHFRFVGVEFKTGHDLYVVNLVQLDNSDKSAATVTHHVTFDRCYFLADTTAGARRGLLGNAAYLAVTDSYFEGFREVGADSQAIVAYNTPGPIKLINNYLSGAGENVLFGGADSADPSLVPSDIEIRGNHFFKPLSWIGSQWVVKNLLEFKSVHRVLVTGNLFENNWSAAQSGFSLLITPRNQNGNAPWSVTEDIAITNNRFVNLGSGINILGADSEHPSKSTARILIKNNQLTANGLNNAAGWAFLLLAAPLDVTIDHNTIFSSTAFLVAENAPGQGKTDRFTFTNNIVVSSAGLIGRGTGPGLNTLNTFFSNWTIAKNAITSGSENAYPSGNFFPFQMSDIRFVNAVSGNFSLAGTSPYKKAGTDGLDLGADLSAAPNTSASAIPQPPKGFQVH